MKVLHITFQNVGGAGIAAHRLSEGLKKAGVDSSVLVCRFHGENDSIIKLSPFSRFLARLHSSLAYRGLHWLKMNREEVRSVNLLPSPVMRRIKELKPDIVNLHWVNAEMLSIRQLGKLNIPTVWTLHDMWPFCGAEHYTMGDRYERGYSRKNFDSHPLKFDVDRWVFRRKQKAWKNWQPHIVTPSNWLADCARKSVLFKNLQIKTIPNCLDLNMFRPLEPQAARKKFGLPLDKKLILFGAFSPSDPRKGGDLLEDALNQVSKDKTFRDVELVVFGADSGPDIAGIRTHWLGSFSDEETLAQLYSAVDLFAAPSRQDNLPNTVAEAIACGTPVVAFNIGGMPDMVEHQQNGWLACSFDVDDYASGLTWVLSNSEVMGNSEALSGIIQNARNKACDLFDESSVAAGYMQCYLSMLMG